MTNDLPWIGLDHLQCLISVAAPVKERCAGKLGTNGKSEHLLSCCRKVHHGFSPLSDSHVPPKVLSGCVLKIPFPFYLGPKKTS